MRCWTSLWGGRRKPKACWGQTSSGTPLFTCRSKYECTRWVGGLDRHPHGFYRDIQLQTVWLFRKCYWALYLPPYYLEKVRCKWMTWFGLAYPCTFHRHVSIFTHEHVSWKAHVAGNEPSLPTRRPYYTSLIHCLVALCLGCPSWVSGAPWRPGIDGRESGASVGCAAGRVYEPAGLWTQPAHWGASAKHQDTTAELGRCK